MDDEELRARLDGLLKTAVPVQIPPISAIRRRMRRRQARQASVGALACACIVVSAVVIRGVVATPGPTEPSGGLGRPVPGCASQNVGVQWIGATRVRGVWAEAPPETYLLGLRNIGHAACELRGWPRLAMTRPPQRTSIVNATVSTVLSTGAKESVSRLVEPTTVRLRPGATVVSAVTVTLLPAETGCVRTAWVVTTPVKGSAPHTVPGGPRFVCMGTSVTVSPFYPQGVPLTQNYPRSAHAPSPAATTNPQPSANAGPAAAPYFVTIDTARAPSPAVVRAWRTGRVTATIQPPAGSGAFTGVAAAGDDSTFVLAAGGTRSRFYQLTLWHGTVRSLSPLPIPPIGGPGTPFALSVDGSKLALALPAAGGAAKIVVISLAAGWERTWASRQPGLVNRLSWAGNVRLAFEWNASSGAGQTAAGSGLRVLDTAAPGGDLLASRLLIPATVRFGALSGVASPLVSADGSVVFATMTSRARGSRSPTAAVAEFSGTTGRPLRLITPVIGESGFGTWCGALWADPSGRVALAACGVQGESRSGHFTQVSLHFPAPNFSAGPDFFAW